MADPIPSSDKRFGLKELERHARIPLERIEFYSDPDPLLIAEIECGVLLVMHFGVPRLTKPSRG